MGLEQCGQFVCQLCYRSTSLPPPSMKAPTAPCEGPFNYCFAKNAAAAPLLVVIFLARPEYWIPRAQRCGGYEHGENSLLFSHDRRPPCSLALMKFVLVLCKQFGLPVQSRILDGLQFPFLHRASVYLRFNGIMDLRLGASWSRKWFQRDIRWFQLIETRLTVGSFVECDFKVVLVHRKSQLYYLLNLFSLFSLFSICQHTLL